MKRRFLSPIYFVIAVYALLAVIGFFELRCLASGAASQPYPPAYLLALNKVEDWRKVKKKIGSPVLVITKSGQSFDGNLFDATDDSLKVRVQGQTHEVKKDDVAEVRVKKKGGGNKAAWIGGLAAAGFGIGAAIGKSTNPDDESGLGSFGPWIGGAIGAAGGALTGAVIAGGKAKVVGEETIYRAP